MISTVDYATTNLARWCNYLKPQDVGDCPGYQGVLFYDDYTVLDIAAHEWTHAVNDYAVQDEDAGLYGLTMSDQSGGVNESYSDIFGVLIEEEYGSELDWDIGEDSPSGIIRNLADPTTSASLQPDEWSEYDDTQDSHYNSGIPNKAAYLMMREPSDGSEEFNGVYVTGLGLDKAEYIFYYTLRDELITSATFADNYNALMQTCLTLEVITIDDSDCESIFDAYAAIGVNTDTSFALAQISASATSGTGPLTVTFDGADSVGINSTITDYTWDFGDGSTDSGGAVSHTFSNPGTYTVSLTVIDSTGYTSDTSTTITVYASGTISADTTWSAAYSPYVISGSVTVASGYTLTIEPGTVVKLLNTSTYLNIAGTLDAQGTATDAIVFTSYKDDDYGGDTNGDGTATTPAAGDWYYFRVNNTGSAILDYVTMQYGGYTGTSYDYGMFFIDDNAINVTVDNSTLQYSQYHTLQIDTGSTSTITNSTISNNTGSRYGVYSTGGTATLTGNTISATSSYGVYAYNSSPTIDGNTFTNSAYGVRTAGTTPAPTITDNTFTDNTYPIYLSSLNSGMTLTGNTGSNNTYNAILLTGSTIGDFTLDSSNDLIYTFLTFTVTSANTLTIEPGTVIKFYDTSSYLGVSGTLDAQGTVTNPIIFTSIKDDVSGGDTNNDGAATTPAAGDWYYFRVAGSAATATLDYTTMQYGGSGSSAPYYFMFLIDDNVASVMVDHSTLQYSQYYILKIDPGSTSTISNSTMSSSTSSYGIYIAGGTSTLTNNTIGATSNTGIYISNASPTLTGNTITNSIYGVYATNGANPTLSDNLIYDNTSYGLLNADSSVTVTAENNWWGDVSGPYNATTNPTGTGNAVSDYVDFDPWTTTDPTADITPPGDVTLGTVSKDVWTPSTTLNWTNPTDTDFDHVQINQTNVTAGTTTTLSSTETGTTYIDTTPAYATDYTYTLYACDTTGNCSTGVITASQRVRNPAPVQQLLTSGDTTLTVNWRASSAPAGTVAGYNVYYGTTSTTMTNVVDVGNVTTTTLTGLPNFTRYYVAVSAYNRRGMESDLSNIRAARPHP